MTQHDLDVLDEIQRRVLWLATRIVDAANHDRATGDGVKVGGHQASSASLVTAMTALWFAHLDAEDRVAVKPHASPVFHAIQYLLGNLDRSYLPRLRARGGLQSYPSRTKDPDEVDFSTGSVGLGAAAPLFAAATRRYVDAHFGARPHSRFVALIGDAELDEGNIWEAVADPATTGLGNVMWLVDFNRQSLDRVVPGIRINQWRGQFEAAGWHVVEVKYGRRLAEAYARPGGEALRDWIDAMPNEQYQSLFGLTGPALRKQFLDGAPAGIDELIAHISDEDLGPLVTDLGGHDLSAMLDAYAQCDAVTDRPSVVFAYTVKGWGLPIAGNPRNHSALLSSEQVDTLRAAQGLTSETEWDRLDPASPAGIRAGARREALSRAPRERALGVTVPESTGVRATKPISTQEVFGRVLVDLARNREVGRYLVTTAPDVATSTNLAGFINKTGVFAPTEQRSWTEDRMLRWTESPAGQHIELGISEMNLFLLLGQLGLSWDLSGQPLLPVGTVYDPFVLRGLDAFLYGTYSGSRFVVAGTPSGITLAPEGGAHQSTITASVGLELPGVTFLEPAYAASLDWLLCDALGQIAAWVGPGRDRRADRGWGVLLPVEHPAAGPGAVRGGPRPARRRGPASAGGRRGVPAGRRAPGVPAPGRRPGGATGRLRRGAARGVGRCGGAGRRGRRRARGGRDEPRPALPGLAAHPAPGRADGHRAQRAGRAAVRVRRSGAGGDRARRRVARDGLARFGGRRPGGAARRGRVRPVRQRRRAVRVARPAARQHRQRRAGRHRPTLTAAGSVITLSESHRKEPVRNSL